MIALNIGVLTVVAAVTWWLTGRDKTVSGESKRTHYFSRALRCLCVLFLVAVMLWLIEGGGGPGGFILLLIIPVSIALLLRSSVSEVFSQGFLQLIDPTLHDHRPLDLKQIQRHQDAIAQLIHQGKRDEAIRLCEELQKSGEVDAATLATALEFLGVKQIGAPLERPLNEVARLRAAGNFSEAEQLLKALLQKNPADEGAALALLRLYAQDLRQPSRAHEVLRALEKQKSVSAACLEFARRSIDEWSKPKPVRAATTAAPTADSPAELLAQKSFGSAIELLEQKIASCPDDFELRLKLAEVHAIHCGNVSRAEKIFKVARAENRFSAGQLAMAANKLKEWREIDLPRK